MAPIFFMFIEKPLETVSHADEQYHIELEMIN